MPEGRSIKRKLAAVAAAILVLAIGGCGSGRDDAAGDGLTNVKVGTQPFYDYQFFKIAHELGVDREFGLNLVDVSVPGAKAFEQLASGGIDIAASCESCALPAIGNMPTLRNFMITERFDGFRLIGRAEGGKAIGSTYADFQREGGDPKKVAADFVATLRGKSLAVAPEMDGALLGSLLNLGGLTQRDVTVVPFPDEEKAALAFIAGTGDYYFGSLPQELRMLTSPDLKDRFVEAGPAELFPLNYANFAATETWLSANADTATKLVAVWFRVTRYLYEKPDRLLDIMARELQSQTGGLFTRDQTRLALTKFMYFAPFEKAYADYFDPKSLTWEGVALRDLYQQAITDSQIVAGTDFRTFEVSAKYFDMLSKRHDLVDKIQAPLV